MLLGNMEKESGDPREEEGAAADFPQLREEEELPETVNSAGCCCIR